MKLLEYTIVLPTRTSSFTLIPFGDIHFGDKGCAVEEWQLCVHEIATTPNCYAIGMGDYMDSLRTTAMKHVRGYSADNSSFNEIDASREQAARGFYHKYLEPIQKKVIGLIEGNHKWVFKNDMTDTQKMCEWMGCHYLTKLAAIRLNIKDEKGRQVQTLTLLAHHGDWSGGNSRAGGDMNAMEGKGGSWDADIALYGHTHRKLVHNAPIMTLSRTGKVKVVERPKVMIRTGGFLRGYVGDEKDRYIEEKLLSPVEIGFVRLGVKFSEERVESGRQMRCRYEVRY